MLSNEYEGILTTVIKTILALHVKLPNVMFCFQISEEHSILGFFVVDSMKGRGGNAVLSASQNSSYCLIICPLCTHCFGRHFDMLSGHCVIYTLVNKCDKPFQSLHSTEFFMSPNSFHLQWVPLICTMQWITECPKHLFFSLFSGGIWTKSERSLIHGNVTRWHLVGIIEACIQWLN